MIKSKSKSKKFVKGVALGFATMLSTTAMPVGAVVALAQDWTGGEISSNTHRIAVGEQNKTTKSYVTKGERVAIPQGVYYGQSSSEHVIGSSVSGTITKSEIFVTYANGDNVQIESSSNTFVADRVGSYKITYSVVDNDVLYTYDLTIECEASEVEFEFKANDEHIIPSIYDVAIANDKDIILPLPVINGEDGKEVLENKKENFTTSTSDKDAYVVISITNGSDELKIDNDGENFVIKTIDGGHITSALKGKEYTINYSYYEKKGETAVFVSSTSKTFTVRDGYYKKSSKENAENGYDLVATLSSKPDSAVVGVEKTLPTISATTKAENSPSSESVDIFYTLKVYTKDENGAYKTEVTNDVITEEGTFKANKEGDYLFKYVATDFYGNTNESSSEATTFTITKVKDTKSPDVYMYDAGLRTEQEVQDKTYRSAETSLKSTTVNRNIIMYAIGGKDNLDSNELTFRREIWDGSYYKRFIIKEQAYNDYNLIFAPTAGDMSDIYQQIVNDNHEIYRQMIVDGKNASDSETIKQWLKDKKYLLVTTTFNEDIEGGKIYTPAEGETFTEESENVASKMIEKGYAYIKPEIKDYTFSTSDTYTFYYYADDNHGNAEGKIDFTVNVNEKFNDESAPTISFPTDLQSSYLPTDTITFKTITPSNVSDNSIETRPVVGTAYRFLKLEGGQRVPAQTSSQDTQTLTYVAKGRTEAKYENKYFYADRDSQGKFTSEGWYIDQEAESYKIDLSKRPEGAQYVEILAYAIDDCGNIGFYNKVIRIASVDESTPTLDKVSNIPSSSSYEAPQTITLPTLQYSDDRVEGMHARVDLYKIEGSGANTTKQALPTSGMTTSYDTQRGIFRVDAGSFNASSKGDYQVVVTVIDSANHSLSTYFNYHVNGQTIIEEPEISNISTETKEIELGKSLYLPTPTLSVTESDNYGYIGLGDEDDSNNATYYFPQVISSSNSDYELDGQYFTGNTEGTYKIQYNVMLVRYNKDASAFGDTPAENKLSLDSNGRLVYTQGSTNYFVYVDKNDEGKYELRANKKLNGTGSELSDKSTLNGLVKVFALQSKTITVSVKKVVIDVSMPNDAYAKTDYPVLSTDQDNPTVVEIVKPDVSVRGSYEINKKDSTVTITYSSNSSSSEQLAKINLEEWEASIKSTDSSIKVDGKKINLKLTKSGQYKIVYSIQAQNKYGENVGDPKELTYTLRSGDNIKPEFEIKQSKFTTSYALGESMHIEFAGTNVKDMFVLDDNDTSVEELLKSLKVTLKGPSKTETLTNEAEDKTKNFEFNYTFEEAGDYTLTFQVTDGSGNTSSDKMSFTVKAKESKPVNVKQVLGGVLIGVSVALLAGVVIYFIVSKVKLDKKERSYKKKQ